MNYGLWLSSMGLQVNDHRQGVIANNLANLNTTGFKRDLSVFRERRIESESEGGAMGFRHPLLDAQTGGTWLNPTVTEHVQGPLVEGGPLDLAIDGDGFFTVQVGDETRYTRDGGFTLDVDGNLVTVADGHPVLDESGQPIQIGRVATEKISIGSAGKITIGEDTIAQLGVADFADRSQLVKAGGNTFDGSRAEPIEASGQVRQGRTEASTVEPTTELVQMIEAARAYQLNATLISYQDGMLGRVVNEVGRVR